MSAGLAPPEIVALSEAHAIAIWQSVLIQVWEAPLDSAAYVRELGNSLAALKRMRRAPLPGPLLALGIVSAHTNMPDSRGRAVAAEFPSYFDYYVGVHEGPPHRGWLVRTVLGAMALAARVQADYDLVGDVAAACRKLAGRSDGSVAADELQQVISHLRSLVAAEGAPARPSQDGVLT